MVVWSSHISGYNAVMLHKFEPKNLTLSNLPKSAWAPDSQVLWVEIVGSAYLVVNLVSII